jgi:hypothetical protein
MATWEDSPANDSDKTANTMEEGNDLSVTEFGRGNFKNYIWHL